MDRGNVRMMSHHTTECTWDALMGNHRPRRQRLWKKHPITINTVSLPLPVSANINQFREFGREIIGANIVHLSHSEFLDIERLLYKVFEFLVHFG